MCVCVYVELLLLPLVRPFFLMQACVSADTFFGQMRGFLGFTFIPLYFSLAHYRFFREYPARRRQNSFIPELWRKFFFWRFFLSTYSISD